MAIATTSNFTLNRHDLIKRALRMVGAITSGQTPSEDKIQSAAIVLNSIIKELDADKMYLWQLSSSNLTLVAGQQSYTSSDGLPTDIYMLDTLTYLDSSTSEFPVDRIDHKRYEDISDKTVQDIPEKAFLTQELDLSSRTLYIWPTAQSAATLRIRYRRRLFDFDTAENNPDLPAEWFNFLAFKIAVDLAEEYGVTDNKIKRLFDRSEILKKTLSAASAYDIDNVPMERDYF